MSSSPLLLRVATETVSNVTTVGAMLGAPLLTMFRMLANILLEESLCFA